MVSKGGWGDWGVHEGEPDGGQCRAGVGRDIDWWGDISKIEY